MVSPNSWGLHCMFVISHIWPGIVLSGLKGLLTAIIFRLQAFLQNLVRNFCDPVAIVYYIPTKPESSKHTSFALRWKHTRDFLDNSFIKPYLSGWLSCNVCFMKSCPTYFVMDRGILISQYQLCREWTEYKYWEKIRLPKVGNMLSTTCYLETKKWWTLWIILVVWSGYFYLHLRDWDIEIE